MAKQQKKSTARRTPRATEPRMYGDGKPSQPLNGDAAVADQSASERAAPERPVVTATPNRVPTRTPAPRTPAVRATGVTPCGADAAGSYARVDRIADYSYVKHDLRRLGMVAAGMLALLVVLGLVIR